MRVAMRKVWVLDTETKGTGAHVVPLEKALTGPPPSSRRASRSRGRQVATGSHEPRKSKGGERKSGPLPAGHVRKKTTGEIGRVRSVDPKAGTASVLWLRQGRTSTVPLTAISRR
jgi:hypothetical protein